MRTRLAKLLAGIGSFAGAAVLITTYGVTGPDVAAQRGLGALQGYLAARGYAELTAGGRRLSADPPPRLVPAGARAKAEQLPARGTHGEYLFGPASLATPAVCAASRATMASAGRAGQFLANWGGAGPTTRGGAPQLDGLHAGYRRVAVPEACPGNAACAVILTLYFDQRAALRRMARDTTGSFPTALADLASAMDNDPQRANSLAQVPACLRPAVSVRAGRSDLEPVEDDPYLDVDAGTP